MNFFHSSLQELQNDASPETWYYLPHDQLTDQLGPLSRCAPGKAGLVLVESRWQMSRRPYHLQKIALLWANQRQFALEQARRGVTVRYLHGEAPVSQQLLKVIAEVGPLVSMEPAERELWVELQPLVEEQSLTFLPHEGWMSTQEEFVEACGSSPPWRMDAFYRYQRKKTGFLMESGKPVGGKYSYDPENRLPWKGDPPVPEVPLFPQNPIKQEVCALLEEEYAHHPGKLRPELLPTTAEEAQQLWDWAKDECMEYFGPYEDAMSYRSSTLFHTRVSPLLNIHRLLPTQVVEDVLGLEIPLPSKEGFVRQVMGWREFVRQVHVATNGFRSIPGQPETPVQDSPGEAGYSRWTGISWPKSETPFPQLDGGALPSNLGADNPLPPAFWGTESGLSCLDTVVEEVWDEGYSHHITRLMILSNLATLLDLSPREVTDWFWVAYIDAWDWVVEPNVLGMGTFAIGEVMTTKPYISGTPYIHKMSDYCERCSFHPKKTCPISNLYWQFLQRHEESLRDNFRMKRAFFSLAKRSVEKKERDRQVFLRTLSLLQKGEKVTPESLDEESHPTLL